MVFEFGSEKDEDGRNTTLTRSLSKGTWVEMDELTHVRSIGKYVKMRPKHDDMPQSWWFASTGIPLIAATIGPLANVLSIAALVTTWRSSLANNGMLPEGKDESGVDIADPHWEIILNAISLVCGFVGNIFLLLNFTKRIRYIVALPLSIVFWFLATGLLTGIIIAMHVYSAPIKPGQTWTQGYWHAVIAAILYMIGSTGLMINMLGYFLGHYPQHFDLDDSQRTLILQTMMFFFWLAAGAAAFQKVAYFSYSDALYFCNVTVLTIGFGDFVAPNNGGRALVFPYSVIGIIFLGLMINSIRNFAESMSRDKVIRAHEQHERIRTIGRTVTNEEELRDRLGLPPTARTDASGRKLSTGRKQSLAQYGKFEIQGRTVTFSVNKASAHAGGRGGAGRTHVPRSREEKKQARKDKSSEHHKRHEKRQKLLLLREEKDRFEAMREIEQNTRKFQQYYALAMSVFAFGVLWCLGALFFMLAEAREQQYSYFQALYFCYVSLLTIGYGDYSPRSNAGKAFFVVWSLLAIPTMTILISDMGDTVVGSINRGTFTLADWTVMPRQGAWKDFLVAHPRFHKWLKEYNRKREGKKRLKRGFEIQNPDADIEAQVDTNHSKSKPLTPTLEQLATHEDLSEHHLARKLALAIKRAAHDLHDDPPKKYGYEDWVEFTRLIRFSAKSAEAVEEEEEEEGLVEWDWIGEDSPMLANISEAEWILDRLCESLTRYTRRTAHKQLEEHGQPHESPHLRKRNSHHRMRVEMFPHGHKRVAVAPNEDEASASGSNNSGMLVDPKDEHFHDDLGQRHPNLHHQDPLEHEVTTESTVKVREGGEREHKHHHDHQHHVHTDEGLEEPDFSSKREELTKMHKTHESDAVRDWEAKIATAREEARLEKEKGGGA